MGKKTKTLCNWEKKDIEKDWAKLRKMVMEPKFVCQNCGRAAAKKKWVCEPKRL